MEQAELIAGTEESRMRNLLKQPRRRQVSAAAGLVAVAVAGSAYLLRDSPTGRSENVGATQPAASADGVTPSAAASVAADTSTPATSATGATTTPPEVPSTRTTEPRTADERLAAARKAGENDVKVQRPLIRTPTAGGDVTITERGDVRKSGKTLRVVTAKTDLTGYGELGWVADGGVKVGNASCSQTFRLSNEQTGKVRPTLMVCWRTSAERSVYTVSVNVHGRPSKAESARAIDVAWAKLR
jgi:hypothetical protein